MVPGRVRVLHVGKFYPPETGGMETHLRTLCTALVPHVDVEVLVANRGRETVVQEVDGVRVRRLGTLMELAGASVCPGMVAALRQSDADVVHLHHPNPTAALAWFASRPRGRLIVTYHSDIVRQRLLGALISPLTHRLLRSADAVICTSDAQVRESRVLARHRQKCRVLPFAADTSWLERPDPAAIALVRTRYGPRQVLAVGRLVGYKGLDYAIRAMQEVDGSLVVIGDGPMAGRLRALAQTLGVTERVHMLGRVRDPAPYFHAADVLVLPSTTPNEAFGLVQLEAMSCGKPVVNTRLPTGVPSVSVDGETGITVPPGDTAALAAALRMLLQDPELRNRYGRAARLRVQELFTVPAMGAATLALYESVLAVTSRHGRPQSPSEVSIPS